MPSAMPIAELMVNGGSDGGANGEGAKVNEDGGGGCAGGGAGNEGGGGEGGGGDGGGERATHKH